MTEQRWSIPVEELVAGARVPVEGQIEVQDEPRQPGLDRSAGADGFGDGMSGDADGA
jgi:hypothetical protein